MDQGPEKFSLKFDYLMGEFKLQIIWEQSEFRNETKKEFENKLKLQK